MRTRNLLASLFVILTIGLVGCDSSVMQTDQPATEQRVGVFRQAGYVDLGIDSTSVNNMAAVDYAGVDIDAGKSAGLTTSNDILGYCDDGSDIRVWAFMLSIRGETGKLFDGLYGKKYSVSTGMAIEGALLEEGYNENGDFWCFVNLLRVQNVGNSGVSLTFNRWSSSLTEDYKVSVDRWDPYVRYPKTSSFVTVQNNRFTKLVFVEPLTKEIDASFTPPTTTQTGLLVLSLQDINCNGAAGETCRILDGLSFRYSENESGWMEFQPVTSFSSCNISLEGECPFPLGDESEQFAVFVEISTGTDSSRFITEYRTAYGCLAKTNEVRNGYVVSIPSNECAMEDTGVGKK